MKIICALLFTALTCEARKLRGGESPTSFSDMIDQGQCPPASLPCEEIFYPVNCKTTGSELICPYDSFCQSLSAGFLPGECIPSENDQQIPTEEQALIDRELQAAKEAVLAVDLDNPGQVQELFEAYRVPGEDRDMTIHTIHAMQEANTDLLPLSWVDVPGVSIIAGGDAGVSNLHFLASLVVYSPVAPALLLQERLGFATGVVQLSKQARKSWLVTERLPSTCALFLGAW